VFVISPIFRSSTIPSSSSSSSTSFSSPSSPSRKRRRRRRRRRSGSGGGRRARHLGEASSSRALQFHFHQTNYTLLLYTKINYFKYFLEKKKWKDGEEERRQRRWREGIPKRS